MWMTDRPLYGPGSITTWVDVGEPLPQADGTVAFHYPVGAATFLSARAGGELTAVDQVQGNERFTLNGAFAKVTIGEGLRVYGVV